MALSDLNIFTAAFGVALLLAAAWIGVRAGTERTLRTQRDDAITEADELRKVRDDRDAAITDLRDQLAKANARIDVLQSLVTGEVQLTALADLIEHHHAASERHWNHAQAAMDGIHGDIRDLIRILTARGTP